MGVLSKNQLSKSSFLKWLSGFVDGEGCFMINIDPRGNVSFSFKIELHIDDIEILQLIQLRLGVGNVNSGGNYASYNVGAFSDIANVIVPTFEEFSLKTVKALDFADFAKAVKIELKSPKLIAEDLKSIRALKKGMNKGRVVVDENLLLNLESLRAMDKFWLLGFVEGEGTFGIKNLVPYFQVAQHSRSILTINLIAKFMSKLPRVHKETINTNTPSSVITINKRTSVYPLTLNDIDVLYDYIIPLFESIPFQTRKGVDFSY